MMTTRMRKGITVTTLALALFGVGACESTHQPSSPAAQTSTSQPAPPTTSTPAPEPSFPESSETPAAPEVYRFGQTVTYEDGLAVTVSAPQEHQVSESALNGSAHYLIFTVTIRNGTSKSFDPTLSMTSASQGGTEVDQVVDFMEGETGFAPQTSILPGRSVSYTVTYGTGGTNGVTLEVNPYMFEYDSAVFAN